MLKVLEQYLSLYLFPSPRFVNTSAIWRSVTPRLINDRATPRAYFIYSRPLLPFHEDKHSRDGYLAFDCGVTRGIQEALFKRYASVQDKFDMRYPVSDMIHIHTFSAQRQQ